jgi:endoribonuclease Dicer
MLQETVIIISKNHILFQNYSGDSVTHSRLEKYLAGGEMMKKESLHYSSLPCERLESDEFHDQTYRVASTEAVVNLSSSITLIYLYCSRLPSDGYFKPTPRWDKQKGILYLPKSCPIQAIRVQGDTKFLKNIACLEACKQLHKIGALTDYLVPSIVVEEAEVEEFGKFSSLLFIFPFILVPFIFYIT